MTVRRDIIKNTSSICAQTVEKVGRSILQNTHGGSLAGIDASRTALGGVKTTVSNREWAHLMGSGLVHYIQNIDSD